MKYFATATLILWIFAEPLLAEPLSPKCLQSVNVTNRSVSTFNQSISCTALEKRKEAIYRQIDDFISTATASELEADVARLKARLASAEQARNWTALLASANLVGNVISTIGIATCIESAGIGCAGAAISTIIAKLGVIDSSASFADKESASRSIRGELDLAQRRLERHRANLSIAKNRLVVEFNQICQVVLTDCT